MWIHNTYKLAHKLTYFLYFWFYYLIYYLFKLLKIQNFCSQFFPLIQEQILIPKKLIWFKHQQRKIERNNFVDVTNKRNFLKKNSNGGGDIFQNDSISPQWIHEGLGWKGTHSLRQIHIIVRISTIHYIACKRFYRTLPPFIHLSHRFTHTKSSTLFFIGLKMEQNQNNL